MARRERRYSEASPEVARSAIIGLSAALLLVAFQWISPPASAMEPSFDCAKSLSKPLLRIICASPQLSEQTIEIAQTSSVLQASLSSFALTGVNTSLRSIIKNATRGCDVPQNLPLPNPEATYVPCLNEGIQQGLDYLRSQVAGRGRFESTLPIDEHIRIVDQLQRAGFLPVGQRADGVIGPNRRLALSVWQASKGFPSNGFLDPEQFNALMSPKDQNEIRVGVPSSASSKVTELNATPPITALTTEPSSAPKAYMSSDANDAGPASVVRSSGPSFDCGKIGIDALATIICASKQLSRQNLLLAQTYYALRAQVGPDGRDTLKSEAKLDNSTIKLHCAIPNTTPLPNPVESYVTCVQEETSQILSVWKSRLSGDFLEEATRPIDQLIDAQQELARLGLLSRSTVADGIFGERTRKALSTWQTSRNIPPTSLLNNQTAAELLKFPHSPAIPPRSAPNLLGSDKLTPLRSDQADVVAADSSTLNNPTPILQRPSGDETSAEPATSPGAHYDNQLRVNNLPKQVTGVASGGDPNTNSPNSISPLIDSPAPLQSSMTLKPTPTNGGGVLSETPPLGGNDKELWTLVLTGILVLGGATAAVLMRLMTGVRRMPTSSSPLELWRMDRTFVVERVLEWLRSGPFGHSDISEIEVGDVTLYIFPILKISCTWCAGWSGLIGRIDRGSLNVAMNTYHMAKSHYDLLPDDARRRSREPKRPVESDHVSWSHGNGCTEGRHDWACVSAADLANQMLPLGFDDWCREIGGKLGFERMEPITDPNADPISWVNDLQTPPTIIPWLAVDGITDRLTPTISKVAAASVKGDLPIYHRGITHGVELNWHSSVFRHVPVYLVRYKISTKEFTCVVDALDGTFFHGQRARDVRGTFKRIFSKLADYLSRKRVPRTSSRRHKSEWTGEDHDAGGHHSENHGESGGPHSEGSEKKNEEREGKRKQSEGSQKEGTTGQNQNANETRCRSWNEILDVSKGASFEDIKHAYRKAMSLYHPDKVASLAPEFQELAEIRTKEINLAYETAKRLRETASH